MSELTRGGDCARYRAELGVYVLGAVGPAERAQIDRHLADCPRCREELAALAGMPGLLRRVPPDAALQAWTDDPGDPPPGPNVDALIGRVSAVRRRRRLTAAAAAALLVAIAVAAGGYALEGRPASTTAAAAARWTDTDSGADAITGARAVVRYAAERWGTELEVRVTGVPARIRCQLRVVDTQGQDVAAGGWIITRGSQYTWYPASVPLPASSLRSFVVTSGGQVLVTVSAE